MNSLSCRNVYISGYIYQYGSLRPALKVVYSFLSFYDERSNMDLLLIEGGLNDI